jgi:hypothetical protein
MFEHALGQNTGSENYKSGWNIAEQAVGIIKTVKISFT